MPLPMRASLKPPQRSQNMHLYPNDQDCSAFMELLLCAESSTFEEIVTQNRKSQSNSVLKNYGKSMLYPIMSLHFRLHQRGSQPHSMKERKRICVKSCLLCSLCLSLR